MDHYMKLHAALFHYMTCNGHVISCNYMPLHVYHFYYIKITRACNYMNYMRLHDHYMLSMMLMISKFRSSISANLRYRYMPTSKFKTSISKFDAFSWGTISRFWTSISKFNIVPDIEVFFLNFNIEVLRPQYRDIRISKFRTSISKFANLPDVCSHGKYGSQLCSLDNGRI